MTTERENNERPYAGPGVLPAIAFEHDAANEPVEIRQGQQVAEKLRPARHALKRKHEPRQQNVRQKVKDGELYGLQLILRQRRKRDADGEVGGDEKQCDQGK